MSFTPSHRGGSGPPLVLLHGFADTWRTWELVLPALERAHTVLAVTLPGHAGGPPLGGGDAEQAMLDAVEQAMDTAGFATAALAGNSLGGYLALQLAARDRATSVVALAPAGGWDTPPADLFARQRRGEVTTRDIVADPSGIPAELLNHIAAGVRACDAEALVDHAESGMWHVDAERVACPVRVVWGTEDRLLPWPAAAARYRRDWLPHADWVPLDGVGHCPQLDAPLETAQLILGWV